MKTFSAILSSALLLALCLALGLAGCAGERAAQSQPAPAKATPPPEEQPLYNPAQVQAPAWVFSGGGAQTKDGNKVLFGVGSAPKMQDITMQRSRAANRARAEILKVFSTYIASMMKDYARSTTAGDMSKESYEADVLQVQKTVSIGDLNGAQLADTWRDPTDGTIYIMMSLDLGAVQELMANKKDLDQKLRDYVRDNAAKAFDDLEKEEAKRAK
jgi:predicted secreted protein